MAVKRKSSKQDSSSLDQHKKRGPQHVAAQSDLASAFAIQLLKSPRKRQKLEKKSIPEYIEIEDPIEGSSDEDFSSRKQASASRNLDSSKTSVGSETTQIRVVGGLNLINEKNVSNDDLRIASSTLETPTSAERTPWVERIPLRRTADLCVHKKKIADVQNWLQSAFRRVVDSTVLILTGPAGSGKTATIEALSYELGFDVIEWKNPMSLEWKDTSIERDADGLADQFERFLSISDKYSALDFGQGNTDPEGIHRHKVVLVEDIPNTFSSSNNTSSAKVAFQNSIQRYLLSPRNKYPLILIITETEMRGDDSDWHRSDAMSVRNLMTREILESTNCHQIPFNEVAPTFISKALTRLVDSLLRNEAIDVSQAVLDELARTSNGDIRSAINSLEFISHRFSTHGRTQRLRKKKKRGEILSLTEDESKILNIITNREAALGYFHAIGKIIYNKRIPSSLDPVPYDTLPSHLQSFARERPENEALAILDETSTDIPTFLLGIHQNYIDAAQHDVESIALASDCLSHADAVTHGFRRDGAGGIIPNAVAAITGVLTFLPQNATRRASTVHASVSGPSAQGVRTGGSGAKIYFPQVGKLMKAQREIEDEIDRYIESLQSPRDHENVLLHDNHSEGAPRLVPNRGDTRSTNTSNPQQYQSQYQSDIWDHQRQQSQQYKSYFFGASITRRTAVTELMPFHAQIRDRRARTRQSVQQQHQQHQQHQHYQLPNLRHQDSHSQSPQLQNGAASVPQPDSALNTPSQGHPQRHPQGRPQGHPPSHYPYPHRHPHSNRERGLMRAVTMDRFSTLGRGGVEQKEMLLDDHDDGDRDRDGDHDHDGGGGGGRGHKESVRESASRMHREERSKEENKDGGVQMGRGTTLKVEETDGAASGTGMYDIDDEIDDDIEEIA